MSTNTRAIDATPDQVWNVLADGWLYPLWVVGATRMRDVDESWPDVGSRLHHSVGSWPLMLDDTTEVLESRPGSLLKLKARAWPAGHAEVVIRIRPNGVQSEVTIEENATAGPAALVPQFLQDPPLAWRNAEALQRLAFLCEERH